ncbi:MAG: glycine cleavage system protein H [Deltaproteobacteria bacterium]|nr:glycine cleavage system protein H [Deltaproteobacteria bacterium]MBW2073397.1 glycine cleavage system protein H [Deltaproteobacteria bacterium]RLB83954.1 MAG: glycine cleavage system protein H [Deltaproteobacteria bacterium]
MMPASKKSSVKGLKITQDECIWMKAGVVNFRLCDMNYDCINCSFDKSMAKIVSENQQKRSAGLELKTKKEHIRSWREHFSELDASQRQCRHMLSGRVAYKICANAFQCHQCEFDELIENELVTLDPISPVTLTSVSGYSLAEGYYYHRGHSWALIDYGARIRVGLDDFVTRLFGPNKELELPSLGDEVVQNETGWVLKRDNHRAEMLSPIQGVVTAVNQKVLDTPELIHKYPYEMGWLFMVEPTKMKKNLKDLMSGQESAEWMQNEATRLRNLVAEEYGATASAGGFPVDDIYGNLPEIAWERLVHEFLLT